MRASPRVVSGSGCGHNTSNRWRDAHSWFAACQRASRPLEMTNTGATCCCSNTRALLRRSPRPPAKTTRASAGWAVSVEAWTRIPAAIPHSPPSTTTTSPRPRILRPGGHRPPRPTWCAVACRRASPSSRDHHRPALGVTRSTTNPLIEITTAHAVGLPRLSCQRQIDPTSLYDQAACKVASTTTRPGTHPLARSPCATGGVSQRGWDAGRRARAAQRACGQVGAGGRPVGRSQRGVGRWHRGQAPAQQASRICSSPSSCHSVRRCASRD
jgi:hypothetical protein